MDEIKKLIVAQLECCKAIADDIIKHNASLDVLRHAKKWAQIESPMTGETDAEWVRICWGDVYIFVYMDEAAWNKDDQVVFTGKLCYQLDPAHAYGAELIDVCSVNEFMEKLDTLAEADLSFDCFEVFPPESPEEYLCYMP